MRVGIARGQVWQNLSRGAWFDWNDAVVIYELAGCESTTSPKVHATSLEVDGGRLCAL